MSDQHEGPTVVQVPRQVCSGCIHHDQHMVVSGPDPEYDHNCNHPAVQTSPTIEAMLGHRGRRIGWTDDTPGWCPAVNASTPRRHPVDTPSTNI